MSVVLKPGDIEKGLYLFFKGAPHVVLERTFSKMGRGGAIVRLKLKNLINKSVINETLKGSDKVEIVDIYESSSQYLYKKGNFLVFMDIDSYDQFNVDLKESYNIEDKLLFLREGEIFSLIKWDDKVIDIKLPPKVLFEVIEAEFSLKKDTATNVMKNVTLDTGLVVRAPIFINPGDKILVNSDTREYAERAKG